MRILVTGNTGFKGSWLTLILKNLGHEIFGLALMPVKESIFKISSIERLVSNQYILDIRNSEELTKVLQKVDPEIIIHLAAQPLVISSYLYPRMTFETNAMGTFNILEGTKNLDNLRATLIVTTDKVYKNSESLVGYTELDHLGGDDPYSASKAMADILTQAWRESFGQSPISIARAGNVIGGGDFSKDRLIPDLMKNIFENQNLAIRSMSAVRPWQHVLDCLIGYLNLIDYMLETNQSGEFNFAPDLDSFKSVADLIKHLESLHGHKIDFNLGKAKFKETKVLTLQAGKAKNILNFENRLNFESTIKITYEWYKEHYLGRDIKNKTEFQVSDYLKSVSFKNI